MPTITPTFVWDKNYDNHDQVEPFYADYLKVYEELTAAGQYPYNDSFKGRIPGIEGPNEDTAIYMLQNLRSLKDMEAKVTAALEDGFVELAEWPEPGTQTKYATIVAYGFYSGGTGWYEWHAGRLMVHNRSLVVIPKGRRTRGNIVTGKVLVKA